MTVRQIPTIPGRRLAIELRQLREASVKSAEEAANELRELGGRWSKSKITRIEGAQLVPSVRDTREMLDLYGVQDEEKIEAILELTRNGRNTRGWWLDYRDVLRGGYVAFEAGASTLRTFESSHIPGLLQTASYHRALFEAEERIGLVEYSPEEVDRFLAARQERQRVLDRPDPPLVWAIIDEAALRRLAAWPSPAREQLDHLIKQGSRHHINVQVLPLTAGAHPSMLESFVLLDFPDPHDPPLLYADEGNVRGGHYVDDPTQVEAFAIRFEHLQARALGVPESIDLIAEIRDQLDHEPSERS